jgi:raffinose/stachyose/melibiose transport system permease protein
MQVSRAETVMNYVLLAIFAGFALFPLLTIVVTALGPPLGETGGWPRFGNFAAAWTEGGFGRYMRTSVLVAALVVPVSLVLSVLAGYAFGTMRFRGSTALFYLFLVGLMIPSEAVIVPLFFDLRSVGLTDTIWAVALPQIAQSTAFGTYWMRTQFRSIPISLVEAAVLDGASSRRVLWQILVPVARSPLLTAAILLFMWTWNEFLIPLVMSPTGAWRTAPLALSTFQGQYTAEIALLSAAAVLVALPVVVVYLVLQRRVIAGMLEGVER